MKKRILSVVLVMAMAFILTGTVVSNAKTIKKITDGGYSSEFDSAKIKDGKLVLKGTVTNWARAVDTPEYEKSGTFKFKLAKNCEIIDGYKEDEHNISVKKFNKLCKAHDSDHVVIAFMVEGNKITMLRFW